jgi:hypothetical protein
MQVPVHMELTRLYPELRAPLWNPFEMHEMFCNMGLKSYCSICKSLLAALKLCCAFPLNIGDFKYL